MRQEAQRASGGDRGVLLAQRTGGGVAGIGELARLLARLGRFLRQPGVERGEIGLAHIDLAAHLEHVRRVGGQRLGDVGDGADILGHVLADRAVTAGQRLDQPPIDIAQRTGQAVDLGLGGQGDGLVVGQLQIAADAADEILDLLVGKGIVQAGHRPGVRHLGQMRGRGRADLGVGRVGADQMREGGLDRSVATNQRVIIRIRNLGRILGMVEAVVMGDLAGKAVQLGGGFEIGLGQGLRCGHAARASPAVTAGSSHCGRPVDAGQESGSAARCLSDPRARSVIRLRACSIWIATIGRSSLSASARQEWRWPASTVISFVSAIGAAEAKIFDIR